MKKRNNTICKCSECGDEITAFYDSEVGETIRPISYCKECYQEIVLGKIPDVMAEHNDNGNYDDRDMLIAKQINKRKQKRKKDLWK